MNEPKPEALLAEALQHSRNVSKGLANSLLNKSKKDLAEQHETLVRELMLLWGERHRMQDWIDPIQAVRRLREEVQREL